MCINHLRGFDCDYEDNFSKIIKSLNTGKTNGSTIDGYKKLFKIKEYQLHYVR